MAITKYDLDINKQAIIKPVVILRQGDHDIDTMQVSLSVANEPMDLTGATVTFMGNTANGRQIIDDAHVKIIDAKGGVFEYVFPSQASSDIGEYKVAYFSIILGNGQSSTMDFRVQVLSGVDISAPVASEYITHYDTMVTALNSAYDSATHETNDKMASTVSSLATSAATVLDSALARVNIADSKANNAVSMASSVASAVTSQASYINSVASSAASNVSSVASSAVKQVNSASSVYFKNARKLPDDARDFAIIASDTIKYQGIWYTDGNAIANGPTNNWTWCTVEVLGGYGNGSGVIRTARFGTNQEYTTTVNTGGMVGWNAMASVDKSVQKAGDTMSGNLTAPQVIATDLLTGFHNVIQVPDTTTSIIDLINNDFIKGRGFWKEATFIAYNRALSDAPTNDVYSIVKLATRGTNRTYVEYSDLSGNVWHTTVTTDALLPWVKQANDSEVVHKTGNETVAGDKTLTGNVNIAGVLNSSKPYLEIGSRIKSVDASGVTRMWWDWTVNWTVRNGYVTYKIQPSSRGSLPSGTISEETLPVEARPLDYVYVPLRWGGQGFSIRPDGKFENDTGVTIDPSASRATAVSPTAQGW